MQTRDGHFWPSPTVTVKCGRHWRPKVAVTAWRGIHVKDFISASLYLDFPVERNQRLKTKPVLVLSCFGYWFSLLVIVFVCNQCY